ncbi:MAG: helix-turn-helix transcriptional regulator [Lachnospiraceae bacterium]|nr:helix-turn-helix transcriptional regulator [Lachnospiraceae bacterium]
MILAEKIMVLRKKKGWSQEDLAGKLDVSRQSVSKWESGASVPDIDKILVLSHLFGVSTDYLLKDEMDTEELPRMEEECGETNARVVSMEEAERFMGLAAKLSLPMAAGTALCVLSPICLILLAGMQEYGKIAISADMAGGVGMTLLLVLVAIGAGILVYISMQMEPYSYMEREKLTLQYGVKGLAVKKREGFSKTYNMSITVGTVLCILGIVPLMVAAAFSAPDIVYIYCVSLLFVMVAVGVFLFVKAGTIKGSYDKLLQEGDYTVEKKEVNRRTSFFPGVYWCLVTAIFVGIGMYNNSWKFAAIIWPVAALLFVVFLGIIKAVAGSGRGK